MSSRDVFEQTCTSGLVLQNQYTELNAVANEYHTGIQHQCGTLRFKLNKLKHVSETFYMCLGTKTIPDYTPYLTTQTRKLQFKN